MIINSDGTPAMDLISDGTIELNITALSYSLENRLGQITHLNKTNCTIEFFKTVSQDKFDKNNLNKSLCPIFNDDTKISGDYTDIDNFNTIEVFLFIKNFTKWFNIKENIWLEITFLNTWVDSDSIDNYMGNYLQSYYTLIDPNMIIWERFSVANKIFLNDNGLIYYKNVTDISANVNRIEAFNILGEFKIG